eukprot:bmy_00090T0
MMSQTLKIIISITGRRKPWYGDDLYFSDSCARKIKISVLQCHLVKSPQVLKIEGPPPLMFSPLGVDSSLQNACQDPRMTVKKGKLLYTRQGEELVILFLKERRMMRRGKGRGEKNS